MWGGGVLAPCPPPETPFLAPWHLGSLSPLHLSPQHPKSLALWNSGTPTWHPGTFFCHHSTVATWDPWHPVLEPWHPVLEPWHPVLEPWHPVLEPKHPGTRLGTLELEYKRSYNRAIPALRKTSGPEPIWIMAHHGINCRMQWRGGLYTRNGEWMQSINLINLSLVNYLSF